MLLWRRSLNWKSYGRSRPARPSSRPGTWLQPRSYLVYLHEGMEKVFTMAPFIYKLPILRFMNCIHQELPNVSKAPTMMVRSAINSLVEFWTELIFLVLMAIHYNKSKITTAKHKEPPILQRNFIIFIPLLHLHNLVSEAERLNIY